VPQRTQERDRGRALDARISERGGLDRRRRAPQWEETYAVPDDPLRRRLGQECDPSARRHPEQGVFDALGHREGR